MSDGHQDAEKKHLSANPGVWAQRLESRGGRITLRYTASLRPAWDTTDSVSKPKNSEGKKNGNNYHCNVRVFKKKKTCLKKNLFI